MIEKVLTVNGIARRVVAAPDRSLLDIIRNDFGLKGTKKACNQGYCGACSVIIDGELVRSCRMPLEKIGPSARITTVEGIGTPVNPHPIQKALAYAGAIQCGFCTPGMVVAAKALLDKNDNPGEQKIREHFRHNLCRCTGYTSIIRAVQLAGRMIRGEVTEDELKADESEGIIGKPIPRPTALIKACGIAPFSDDVPEPAGTLHLKVVRSPHHHAKILSVDASDAEKMPGVAGVVTAKDIKGRNRIVYGTHPQFKPEMADEPVLCDELVKMWGDPVAIVAAETIEQAEAAVKKVKVEYEPLPAYSTPKEAMAPDALQIHDAYPNVSFEQPLVKGDDPEKAIEKCDVVVEGEFTTTLTPHMFLEPDCALAFFDEEDRLTIMCRSIVIHYHAKQLAAALGVENDKIRLIESYSGGMFGAKLNITCEGLIGAAALKFRRPCKIVYTMSETMNCSPKRHPYYMRIKLGADKDGTFKALWCDFDVDNGAYLYWSDGLVIRGLHNFGGPYRYGNMWALGRMVTTNHAPGGAFRGFGSPQMHFATESVIDMLASKLGMDPLEIRKKNAQVMGDTDSTNAPLDVAPFPGILEKLEPLYKAAKEKAKKESTPEKKRGVGIAGAYFGCGSDGGKDSSEAWVDIDPDGGVTVRATVADPGEGGDIQITTIVNKALGIPKEKIRYDGRDMARAPHSGPSAGSRQTTLTGKAIANACAELKKAMQENGCKTCEEMIARNLPTHYVGKHQCQTTDTDAKTGHGRPYENRAYVAHMAEIEVDAKTGKTKVIKMTAVGDIGTILNPLAVEGQFEGGLNMGLGFGLWEDYKHPETNTLVKGGIPNFMNSPLTETHFNHTYRPNGTFGATGCGEIVMVPTAAAVANAIEDAVGARVTHLPISPDKIASAMKK